MKLLYTLTLLTLIGCASHEPKIENNYEKIDSIISNSQINIIRSDSVNRESERVIAQKVNQTVSEIKDLKEEVKTAKLTVKTVTVTRVDTIYIETKKNFWGKTRTNTIIKSDSTEVIDSLENK